MKLSVTTLFCLFLVFVCFGEERSSVLPKEIIGLQQLLQDKNPEEAYRLTIECFGEPARKVGSCFRIELWKVGGGTLAFHQALGPTYRDASGSITWLMATRNEVKTNLYACFEMYSLAKQDPNKHGNGYWLGNIDLLLNGKFEYRDSGQHREYKTAFPRHFFADHPTGDFAIEYSEDLSATDALEDIPDDKEICRITFRSGKSAKTFGIVTSRSGRSLRFESEDQVFQMNRGWNQYWPEEVKKAEPEE